MTIDIYFSGIEGSMNELELMFENGFKVDHLMTAYTSFRNNEKYIVELSKLKTKYGFKLIVDSGAHAFIFAKNITKKEKSKGWHDEAKIAGEFSGREEEYFEEYFKWLTSNRELYDYCVEFDIQSVIGQEKVEEWRKQFISEKLPAIFVLHIKAGDTAKTALEWKERGITYVGIGEIIGELPKIQLIGQTLKKAGLKVHAFGFTPKDLFKYVGVFDSCDSSSWLSGSKLAKCYENKGKALNEYDLREDKLKKAAILHEPFFDIFGREKVEEKTRGNQYWYFNFWNMWQMQKWSNVNNGVKGYTKQLEAIEEGKQPAPSWLNTFDKDGNPKSKYLNSRFNNYKSGAYAKVVQNIALFCDNCPVGGMSATGEPLCPKYQSGATCYFIPYWRKLGMNTRNKEQVIRTLEELVAEAMVRYQSARWTEQLTGVIDKNVTALYKELTTSLELYNRVAFGVQNFNTLNMLNVGDNKVQVNMSFDESLERVRELYGDELAKRIEKKIKKVEENSENTIEGE
ncbi:MAG: hypothetical protein QXL94_01975 [Candidatus Parvarchaeum sp.]